MSGKLGSRSFARKISSTCSAAALPASHGSTRASIADQSHQTSVRPSGAQIAGRIRRDRVRPTGPKRSASRARQALKMAAQSLCRSESALGAFYRRLCARMDKPRANTATAHKLARMVYFMLTRGEAFVDQGQQRYEEQQRRRSIAALQRRAAALGFQINPLGTPA